MKHRCLFFGLLLIAFNPMAEELKGAEELKPGFRQFIDSVYGKYQPATQTPPVTNQIHEIVGKLRAAEGLNKTDYEALENFQQSRNQLLANMLNISEQELSKLKYARNSALHMTNTPDEYEHYNLVNLENYDECTAGLGSFSPSEETKFACQKLEGNVKQNLATVTGLPIEQALPFFNKLIVTQAVNSDLLDPYLSELEAIKKFIKELTVIEIPCDNDCHANIGSAHRDLKTEILIDIARIDRKVSDHAYFKVSFRSIYDNSILGTEIWHSSNPLDAPFFVETHTADKL